VCARQRQNTAEAFGVNTAEAFGVNTAEAFGVITSLRRERSGRRVSGSADCIVGLLAFPQIGRISLSRTSGLRFVTILVYRTQCTGMESTA
jgi:hypothetical protein